MTTSSQLTQSEPGMGQKPPSEGRRDPPGPPIVWPWEENEDEPIDFEEVADDQIEENLADEAEAIPFPG